MKPLRPDTFLLTLPDGKTNVRCWKRDAEAIRQDDSVEAPVLRKHGRHV